MDPMKEMANLLFGGQSGTKFTFEVKKTDHENQMYEDS